MFKLQTDAQKLYKKRIFKPLIEQRNKEIDEINKKSTYKEIQVDERAANVDVFHHHTAEYDQAEGLKKHQKHTDAEIESLKNDLESI